MQVEGGLGLPYLGVYCRSKIVGIGILKPFQGNRTEELTDNEPAAHALSAFKLGSPWPNFLQSVRVDEESSQLCWSYLREVDGNSTLEHADSHTREELCDEPVFPSCRERLAEDTLGNGISYLSLATPQVILTATRKTHSVSNAILRPNESATNCRPC